MRSFILPKAFLVASMLSALPLAGAYADGDGIDETPPATMQGTRLSALVDQAQGVSQGIAEAREGHQIAVTEARKLETQANTVARTAQRVAARNHGMVSEARYNQLLRRLNNVDQRLLGDTGGAYDGESGNHYS